MHVYYAVRQAEWGLGKGGLEHVVYMSVGTEREQVLGIDGQRLVVRKAQRGSQVRCQEALGCSVSGGSSEVIASLC